MSVYCFLKHVHETRDLISLCRQLIAFNFKGASKQCDDIPDKYIQYLFHCVRYTYQFTGFETLLKSGESTSTNLIVYD